MGEQRGQNDRVVSINQPAFSTGSGTVQYYLVPAMICIKVASVMAINNQHNLCDQPQLLHELQIFGP